MPAVAERGVCVVAPAPILTLTIERSTDGGEEVDVYARLGSDLRANDVAVICDLQRALLRAALEGGVDVAKISHRELIEDGWATGVEDGEIVSGMQRLCEAGARNVVVSRGRGGALA